MKKKITLPTILALAILAIALTSANVSAQETSYYSPIVQKIAERFNLDADDVEEVFDEERDERRAERFALFADRLDEYEEGKLTVEQKNIILDRHEEIHDAMEEAKNLPVEERKQKMWELHEEYRNMLTEQGLDDFMSVSFSEGLGMGFGR